MFNVAKLYWFVYWYYCIIFPFLAYCSYFCVLVRLRTLNLLIIIIDDNLYLMFINYIKHDLYVVTGVFFDDSFT